MKELVILAGRKADHVDDDALLVLACSIGLRATEAEAGGTGRGRTGTGISRRRRRFDGPAPASSCAALPLLTPPGGAKSAWRYRSFCFPFLFRPDSRD